MNFTELGLSPTIVKSIAEMGFETATEVQVETIPLILESRDLIVMSKTGSGKTGAFGLPMLHIMEKELAELTDVERQGKKSGPEGLILTPTRELAVQVDSDIQKMSKYMSLKTTAIYGQHNMNVEIQDLKKGVSIVTGTPGRVFDHIKRKTLITRDVKFLVLDEADRMLDMGFYDQVVEIVRSLPKNRVTLLFSATMPSEIKKICREYMKQPLTVELESDTKTVDLIKQVYYRVEANRKRTELDRILKVQQPDSVMIFCNTRHAVDKVNEFLLHQGYFAKPLHGAKDQNSRMRTIDKFREGKIQILVATDVAARGIHIDDLTLVINYDVPDKMDSYVHRIGRTGRAGNGGLAMSLVSTDEIMSLYDLEVHVGALIEEIDLPTNEQVEAAVNNQTGKWANLKNVEGINSKRAQNSPNSRQGKGQNQRQGQSRQQGQHQSQHQSQSQGQRQDKRQPTDQVQYKSSSEKKELIQNNTQAPAAVFSKPKAQSQLSTQSYRDHKIEHGIIDRTTKYADKQKTKPVTTKPVTTKMTPVETKVDMQEVSTKKSFLKKVSEKLFKRA